MIRQGHENVDLFIGQEVEHTPAYGQKTLFVVGLQDTNKILDILTNHREYLDPDKHITHVYFGANMSFPHLLVNDYRWQDWEKMITPILDAGYMCTLDIDIACVEGLAEGALCEYTNFIPMISAKIP